MGRALNRTLLLVSIPLGTLVAIACGSSGDSTFPGGGDGDGGFADETGTPGHIGGEGGQDPSVKAKTVSIAWKPAAQTVVADGKTAASRTYDLEATLKDGSKVLVLPESVQFDRPDIATAKVLSTTTLTTPGTYAGTGTLHGVFGTLGATASFTVVVNRKDLNGVSATVAAALDAAATADASLTSLLYPYDKTVFALGLTSPKIMWNAPNVGDTYRFHLEQANYTYDTYATVGQPGQFRIDQSVWDIVTASNKGAGNGLTLKVSRYDAASKLAYVSASETFTIAPESLRGAIYYWTASETPLPDGSEGERRGHISRFRPGTGAVPVALNNGKCMGCHAVNAKGTVLVADVDDINYRGFPNTSPSVAPYSNWSKTRAWASFDVSNADSDAGGTPKLETNKFGGQIALNPDGTYVVFGGPTPVGGGATQPGSKFLSLGKVVDGTVIATSGLDAVNLPAGKGMMMPSFSPDGTKMAIVVSSLDTDNVIPDNTGTTIQYLDFTQATPAFNPTLHALVDGADAVFTVQTGHGLAYPSFTPDSKAIAFHVGTTSTGCHGACDDTVTDDGNLFIQPVAKGGVASPVAMKAASDPPNAAEASLSVEPTFNPDVRGGYSWVVFTSMRTWGNQPFPAGLGAGPVNAKRRLWVAAVDTTLGVIDPSHPAFFLEGQEDTPNMRGFWANATCTQTAPAGAPPNSCTAGYECCSGFCINKVCVDPSTVACAGIGDSCTVAADCCNPDAVACVAGKCKAGGIH